MKPTIKWWQVIAVCILITGLALTVWSAQQQDQALRTDLLEKASIAKTGVSLEQVRSLNGSAADYRSPEYQLLKTQLGKIRASDQDIRFAYLMGQREDGTIIIYADSEPPESENYSPPGEVYDEASTVLRALFESGEKVTEGPLSDRWGTWVSGFIPITDPATGRVIAVFGMDIDARDWNRLILGSSLPTLIAILLIVLIILVSALFQRRSEEERRRLETSEKKFSEAFHANPALMVVSSIEDGRILDVNSSFLATLGYSREEVTGRTRSDLGLYVDPSDWNTIVHQVRETGEVRNMEVRIYRKDRDILDGSLSAIIIDVGGISRLLTVTLDLTERKQADDALRDQEEKYHLLIDNSHDVIYTIDLGGIFTFVSPSWTTLLGHPLEQVIGKPFYKFVHPDDIAKCLAFMQSTFETGQRQTGAEYRVKHQDGSWRWHTTNALPLRDKTGRIVGGEGSASDITVRKENEEALVKKSKELRSAYDELTTAGEELKAQFDALKEGERIIRESEERFNQLAEQSGTVTWEVDSNGLYTFVSQVSRVVLGYRPDELVGRMHFYDLYPETEREAFRTSCLATFERKEPFENIVNAILAKNGRHIWVSTNGIPLLDHDGTLRGYRGSDTDITVRRENEIALVKKSEELRAAYDELATAGEELRTQFDALAESERLVRESEERVLTIIHSMQFGIIIIDSETHTILEANQKALEMVGAGNESILGSVCHRFICPAELGRCPVSDLGQTVDSSERVLLTMKGEKIPILKSVIKTVLGGKEVLIESFIDISERKQAENELRESRERFRQLAEVFPETIFETDAEGFVTYANKNGLEQFGYTEEDFSKGINIYNLVSPDDRDRVLLKVQGRTQGFDRNYLEYQAQKKDGSTFWVMGLWVPVMAHGRAVGLRGFLLDITERKLIELEMAYHEQELMQFSSALGRANKKLTLLFGITRHDINNQLTILMGYLAMLEEQQPDPTLNQYFMTINTAAERIAAMIQFTKEYEQIGVNAPAWHDCRTLVDTAAKQVRLGPVTVQNDLPKGAEVFADQLISKVFYTLVENAVKYGGKITTIRFSAVERGEDHVVVCEDDGVGIPLKEKEKIFLREFGEKTGIGLAISREIIDITGITIHETGEPGKGARFEITVPKRSYRCTQPV